MTPTERPLLVTDDSVLIEELVRIAATVGLEFEVCPDLASARVQWASAPAVLIGSDAAVTGRVALERRDDVLVIGADGEDAGLWERAVRLGAGEVCFLPSAEPMLAELFADLAEGRPEPAPVLAVVGGRGGAGASTLAAALTVCAARRGWSPLLVDADVHGGGIDLLFGAEGEPGLRWPDLGETRGRVSGRALVGALPTSAGVRFLSCARDAGLSVPVGAMESLLPAGWPPRSRPCATTCGWSPAARPPAG